MAPSRCLYEILGVERDADDDALKKAYRQQALIWHPGERAVLFFAAGGAPRRRRCCRRCSAAALPSDCIRNRLPCSLAPLAHTLSCQSTTPTHQLCPTHHATRQILTTDKNAHRADEAHARFQEISNAYEVLSDRSERAFYDRHRDQILRSGARHQAGGDAGGGGAGGERPEDEEAVFAFFSGACYSGYGDGPEVSGAWWGGALCAWVVAAKAGFEKQGEAAAQGGSGCALPHANLDHKPRPSRPTGLSMTHPDCQ